VDFGIVATGSSEYRSITITNPSAFAPMVIEDVYLKNGSVFSMDRSPSVPFTLDSLGARHVLRVSYKPVSRSNELDVDTLLLKSRCALTGIALKGQPGSAEMVLNDWIIPLTGSNGADTLIDTCHDGFEISNAGTAGLTIEDIEVQGDKEFFMKSWTPALPVLLEPSSSVVFSSLCFRTRKVGEYVAELVVRSNATGGDTTALLRSIVTTGVLDSRPSLTSVWYDDQRSVIVVEAVPSGGMVVVSDLQGRLFASSVSDGQTLHIDARAMSGTMLVTYPSTSGHRGQALCISR